MSSQIAIRRSATAVPFQLRSCSSSQILTASLKRSSLKQGTVSQGLTSPHRGSKLSLSSLQANALRLKCRSSSHFPANQLFHSSSHLPSSQSLFDKLELASKYSSKIFLDGQPLLSLRSDSILTSAYHTPGC